MSYMKDDIKSSKVVGFMRTPLQVHLDTICHVEPALSLQHPRVQMDFGGGDTACQVMGTNAGNAFSLQTTKLQRHTCYVAGSKKAM